jgi:hypothetical protein
MEVREEIVSDEDGEQNEVIDNKLEVVVERQPGFDVPKFEIKILAHEGEVEQVKVDRLEAEKTDVSKTEQHCRGRSITHPTFPHFFLEPELDLLPQQTKMWIMFQQPQHD